MRSSAQYGAIQCWPLLRTDLLWNLVGHAMVRKFVIVCYLTMRCKLHDSSRQERMQTLSAINIDNASFSRTLPWSSCKSDSACGISSRQKHHQPNMFESHLHHWWLPVWTFPRASESVRCCPLLTLLWIEVTSLQRLPLMSVCSLQGMKAWWELWRLRQRICAQTLIGNFFASHPSIQRNINYQNACLL